MPRPANRLAFERRGLLILLAFQFLFQASPVVFSSAAAVQAPQEKERAESLSGEALQFWDNKAYPQAIGKFQESIALDPKGETYRDLGDLFSELDMHEEAISAYRSAIVLDSSLEPVVRLSLGEQLLWADRPMEAIPLLASVVANRPHDVEAKRHLALAYRLGDRLKEAETLYRDLLRGNPSDADARKGLAASLLWQGRFRAAAVEFEQVLSGNPSDTEALAGLSRAKLFLDLPEEAEVHAGRATSIAPSDQEIHEQVVRVRERLSRRLAFEGRVSNDSDELAIVDLTLSAHARPRKGLDLDAAVRQLFFRQGSPGKEDNINSEDSVDGTGGSFSLAYRSATALEWRAGAGAIRYDIAGFHPWTSDIGITLTPADTVRFDLGWERSHFDSILSFQNRVTSDSFSLSASKHFLWKTEITASGALIYHHNENGTGQDRENRGERFGLQLTRSLYLRGDIVHVTGIARLGWLGFSANLDVGVFDPRRYTTEEAGIDWRWRFRPGWEFHGTAFGGAQQEKGQKGGPMYSVELGLDRIIGFGRVSLGGFANDSNARGQGEGFRRHGGLLSFLIPF